MDGRSWTRWIAALLLSAPLVAAAADDTGLPESLSGTVSWQFSKSTDNEGGYRTYDFNEAFTWAGTLTNQTPGDETFARYEATTGQFGYTGAWHYVTASSCDTTTDVTYAYAANPSFDKVTLSVYNGDQPYAVLAAQVGASAHQTTVDCNASSTPPLDFQDSRTIAHGDSGRTGTVTPLPGGRLRVSFDVTIGSPTGRPHEYERISADFDIKVPCAVDLAAKKVADAGEESVGALVVRNHGGNDPARQQVVLKKVKGLADDLVLNRVSSRIKVFTAKKGGSEIAFDGSSNRFPPSSLPRKLWVEGFEQSEEMRDAALTLEAATDPDCKDTVKFTVLWVDPPEVRLTAAQSLSPDDAAAPPFVAAQGDDRLGYHRLAQTSVPGFTKPIKASQAWTTETSGRVHPHAFHYPGVVLAVAHEIEDQVWVRRGGSSKIENFGRRKFDDILTEKGDILLRKSDRDDDPDPDDRIYNLNAIGVPDLAFPAGSIVRVRANVDAAAFLLEGKRSVGDRCSEVRTHWVRFSLLYSATGPALLGDIPGDNDAQEGSKQPLSWDLR